MRVGRNPKPKCLVEATSNLVEPPKNWSNAATLREIWSKTARIWQTRLKCGQTQAQVGRSHPECGGVSGDVLVESATPKLSAFALVFAERGRSVQAPRGREARAPPSRCAPPTSACPSHIRFPSATRPRTSPASDAMGFSRRSWAWSGDNVFGNTQGVRHGRKHEPARSVAELGAQRTSMPPGTPLEATELPIFKVLSRQAPGWGVQTRPSRDLPMRLHHVEWCWRRRCPDPTSARPTPAPTRGGGGGIPALWGGGAWHNFPGAGPNAHNAPSSLSLSLSTQLTPKGCGQLREALKNTSDEVGLAPKLAASPPGVAQISRV